MTAKIELLDRNGIDDYNLKWGDKKYRVILSERALNKAFEEELIHGLNTLPAKLISEYCVLSEEAIDLIQKNIGLTDDLVSVIETSPEKNNWKSFVQRVAEEYGRGTYLSTDGIEHIVSDFSAGDIDQIINALFIVPVEIDLSSIYLYRIW